MQADQTRRAIWLRRVGRFKRTVEELDIIRPGGQRRQGEIEGRKQWLDGDQRPDLGLVFGQAIQAAARTVVRCTLGGGIGIGVGRISGRCAAAVARWRGLSGRGWRHLGRCGRCRVSTQRTAASQRGPQGRHQRHQHPSWTGINHQHVPDIIANPRVAGIIPKLGGELSPNDCRPVSTTALLRTCLLRTTGPAPAPSSSGCR